MFKKGNKLQRGRAKIGINIKCQSCGKDVYVYPSRVGIKKACSRNCISKYFAQIYKGEKSHFWKGGLTFIAYPTDWSAALKKAIKQRDNYTCVVCKKKPPITVVHHIDYNKHNCEINNLVTLCYVCHGKTNIRRKYWISYFKRRTK